MIAPASDKRLKKEIKSFSVNGTKRQGENSRSLKLKYIYLTLSVAFIAIGIFSLSLGSTRFSFMELINLFKANGSESGKEFLVFNLRLPRFVLAALVGGSLALAGGISQGIFRNPLVDPSFLGIGSGAALAASIWILGSEKFLGFLPSYLIGKNSFLLQFASFSGASIVTFVLYAFSSKKSAYGSTVLIILTGVALTSTAEASMGFVYYLADDSQMRAITFWRLGSLAAAGQSSISIFTPVLLFCIFMIPYLSRGLNVLALGENEAFYSGFKVKNIRNLALLVISLLVGVAVSLCGNIGFVGLLIPHILRMLIGPDHRILLPLSFFGGAVLLSISDLTARTIVFPAELPIGIITSALGGPFFLYLVIREKGKGGWI
ncbi:FecCD family ABC transporter permease [Leptospira sp. WS92.C1]